MAKQPDHKALFACFKNKKVGSVLGIGSLADGLTPTQTVARVTSTDLETCWAFDLTWYGLLIGRYMLQKTDGVITFSEVTTT